MVPNFFEEYISESTHFIQLGELIKHEIYSLFKGKKLALTVNIVQCTQNQWVNFFKYCYAIVVHNIFKEYNYNKTSVHN